MNKQAYKQTEYNTKELVGKNLATVNLISGRSKITVLKNFIKRLAGKDIPPYDIEIISKSKKKIIVEVNATPIKKNGKIIGDLAILRDLTALRKEHYESARAKEILEKTFASMDSAIFILDNAIPPKIIDANDKAVCMFGYSKKKLIGKTTQMLHVDKKHLLDFEKILYPEIEKKGKLTDFIFEMKKASGVIFPTNHSVMPILDESQKRIGWTSIIYDVSKKVKQEEVIKNSLKSAPVGISIIKNRKIIWINSEFENITGYIPENVNEKSTRMLYPSNEIYNKIGKVLYDQIKKEGIGSMEAKIKKKDGSTIDVIINASTLEGKNTKKEIIVAYLDITHEKRNQEQIFETKKRLEKYLDLIGNIVISLDLNGNITSINKAGCEIIGYKEKDLIGKNWFETCLPKDIKPDNLKYFKKMIANKKFDEKHENPIVTKNGSIKYCSWNNSLIKNKSGKLTGVLSSGTDITERKNFEDKIKDKEKQLSDFFESANEIIQSINDKGRFVFVNKKWCEMLGYSKKEANEMKFTEVLKHDQINHCVKIFKEMLSGKKFENIETVFVSKNKKEIVVSGNVSPKFENGKFIYTIGIFHDITEQKKIEDYEKKHIEELKQMNRLMIGRELKMVELKKEITKLKNNHNYNLEISNHEK